MDESKLTTDEKLADHLKQAEHHLIEAVKLFSGPARPNRGSGYVKRLGGAQETVTTLYRGELVRARGEFKPPKARKLTKVA